MQLLLCKNVIVHVGKSYVRFFFQSILGAGRGSHISTTTGSIPPSARARLLKSLVVVSRLRGFFICRKQCETFLIKIRRCEMKNGFIYCTTRACVCFCTLTIAKSSQLYGGVYALRCMCEVATTQSSIFCNFKNLGSPIILVHWHCARDVRK